MQILFAICVLVNLSPVCVPVRKRDTLHIAVIQLGVIDLQHTSTLALSLHTNKLPTTPLHNINCSQRSTCTDDLSLLRPDGCRHGYRLFGVSICCNLRPQVIQRNVQAPWTRAAQIQITSRQMQEGQERCKEAAGEEHLPPLQVIPPYQTPSCIRGQMHVEQEV